MKKLLLLMTMSILIMGSSNLLYAQPTIAGAACISPDPTAAATVYTVTTNGSTITGIGQLGDITITTALPAFPFNGVSFQFSARSLNRGRPITNTCNDYLQAINNTQNVNAVNWGFAQGRLSVLFDNGPCDDVVDLDIFKSFALHPPIVGPRCIQVGDTVTYSVCNIISGNPIDRIGQDRYFWTGSPANNYDNQFWPNGFTFLYQSADGSSITFRVIGTGFIGQPLFCRFGQCNPATFSEMTLGTVTGPPGITIRNSSGVTIPPASATPLAYCLDANANSIVIAVTPPTTPGGASYVYNLSSNNFSWGFGAPIPTPTLNIPSTPLNWSRGVSIAQSGGEIYLQTIGGCDTRRDVVQIGRNLSSPAFTITSNMGTTIGCVTVGTSGIFTLNGNPGNVPITWVTPPGWVITSAPNGTQITVRVDPGAATTGSITASVGTCASNVSIPVYVRPATPGPVSLTIGGQAVAGPPFCIPRTTPASVLTLTTAGTPGISTYVWGNIPNGWTPIPPAITGNTISITPNNSTIGPITVFATTGGGCLSPTSANVIMSYSSLQPGSITGPSCLKGGNALAASSGIAQTANVSYSVPIVGSTTYTWIIPPGLAVTNSVVTSGTGNSTVTFTCSGQPAASDYEIKVTASTGGACQSPATSKFVTVRLQNNGGNDEDVFALAPAFGAQTLIHGFPPATSSTANGNISNYSWFKTSTPGTIIQSSANRSISLAGTLTTDYAVEATYSNYACKNVFAVTSVNGYRMHQKSKPAIGTVLPENKNVQLQMRPNPASNNTKLQLPHHKGEVTVSVVNADGKLVWKRTGVTANMLDMNTAPWPNGVYWVVAKTATDKIGTQKLIIQKQ